MTAYKLEGTEQEIYFSCRIFDDDGYIKEDIADAILSQDDDLQKRYFASDERIVYMTQEEVDWYKEYFDLYESDYKEMQLLARELDLDFDEVYNRVREVHEMEDMDAHHRLAQQVLAEIREEAAKSPE